MRQRLRSHLTYANVIATVALFLVLGGGTAVALNGTNTVFSDDIVNGQVKLADTDTALRLKCPTGTRYHEGACIEKVARTEKTWGNSEFDCRDEGRRLPTVAELSGFRNEPTINLGTAEWTLQHDEDSSRAYYVGDDGFAAAIADNNPVPYRCVARPTL
jgi:hypothetical protein